MNAPSYFEIHVQDTSRAVAFYREIFGWSFSKAEGLPIEYWRIETEGPRGGLLKRPVNALSPEHGTNAFICSMEVASFDATAAKIRAPVAKLLCPSLPSRACAGRDISSIPRAIHSVFFSRIRRQSSIDNTFETQRNGGSGGKANVHAPRLFCLFTHL